MTLHKFRICISFWTFSMHTDPFTPALLFVCVLAAGTSPVRVALCVCLRVQALNLSDSGMFGLLRLSALALQCLDAISGAEELPRTSISVVGALCRFLLRPRWVLFWLICAWCLDGSGCGVMRVWCLG